MKTWKVELTAGGISLAEAKVQRGIFQEDALSPLLFIIAMMPLHHKLRKRTVGYKLSKSQEKINHLMCMNGIKLFAKKENRTGNSNTRRENIKSGHRDGIWHRKMCHASNEKRQTTPDGRGMELPNKDKIRTLGENETYKYLGILEANTIKQVEMKEKIKKEYHRRTRTRKLLKTKLCNRNLIKGINTWAVTLVRYSGPFLKWTREELKQMDQRTSKLLTMHKALHSRDDVDRLYTSRKDGGRGFASIEDNVDASIRRLEDYVEKHEKRLITAISTDNTKTNRVTIARKKIGKKNNSIGVLKNK